MVRVSQFRKLPTELVNPSSRIIDRVSTRRALSLIFREDAKISLSVSRQKSAIAKGVSLIVKQLRKKGRLVFIGAGTSGRLGILEAAECPPTFNTPPSLVQAIMAGGHSSVFRSKEGAEDKGSQARKAVNQKIRRGDVLVGIAASGVTAFVKEGLKAAKKKGAKTILVTCHPKVSRSLANVVIAVNTGPEVIAGSTRLKAGTATKLVLNSLTVASMVQLGKVFGNRMVDLQPRSRKLKARAINLISMLGKVPEKKATVLLKQAKGNAKTAILMARKKLSFSDAKNQLQKADGHLHKALTLKSLPSSRGGKVGYN